jgi:hypothetical protein
MSIKLKESILIILFISLLISIYITYRLQLLPDKEVKFIPKFEYIHKGEYNYTVILLPSVLYENRTILLPGEIAYIPLVNFVNISFSYHFLIEPPTSGNITYWITYSLESPQGWRRNSTLVPLTMLTFNSSIVHFTKFFIFDITKIEKLIHAIEKETGSYAPTYNLRIIACINTIVNTGSSQIQEDFKPEMTIRFVYQEGNYLSFEGLRHERKNAIGEYVVNDITWIKQARFGSYITLVILPIALIYTALLTLRGSADPLNRIMKKYRDFIIDSSKIEERKERGTIVKVKSIEDLIKLSEGIAKPIIHEQNLTKHIFYILDNDVRYEFIIDELSF